LADSRKTVEPGRLGCDGATPGGTRERGLGVFSWHKLRSVFLCAWEGGHGHTPGVLVSYGDEWKTDWRLSSQPRALLLRRQELSRASLLWQVQSDDRLGS
jgi:hypothetical protein